MAHPSSPAEVVRGAQPGRRQAEVHRRGLVDRILNARARIVTLTAPAGYGKTTLLHQVAARARRTAYLLLEAHHNDPLLLAAALEDALDRAGVPQPAASAGRGPRAVIERVAGLRRGAGLLLELDDVHAASDPPARTVLVELVRAAPSDVRVVLAARGRPPLALGRLRAAGEVEEIGPADLALSPAEAAVLVAEAGRPLDDSTLRRLWSAMEGWPAGLGLAALALAEGDDVASVVEARSGGRGAIAEYLLEEVLACQPPDLQRFLLETSILDRLVPELCDAVCERTDADLCLDRLVRGQLFVLPVDGQAGVYRYAAVFRELLHAELQRRRGRSVVHALHRRAARWHGLHDDPVREFVHLLRAGEPAAAVEVLARHSMALLTRGQEATVQRCLDEFSTSEVQRSAPLALAAAWTAVFRGELGAALRYAAFAEGLRWDGPLPDGTASVAGAVAILRSAICTGTLDEAAALAQRSIDLEPDASPWRPSAHLQLGTVLLLAGELDRAAIEIDRAASLSARLQPAVLVSALGYRAYLRLLAGDVEVADALVDDVLARIRDGRLQRFPPIAFPFAVAGAIRAEAGAADDARRLLGHALRLLSEIAFVFPPADVWVRTLIARGLLEAGDVPGARQVLADARRMLEQHPLDARLADGVRRMAAALDREGVAGALTERELEILSMLEAVQPLRAIAGRLVVSENTVKTHVRRIYRKLNVSSRERAVARAHELGLLPARRSRV